MSEITGVLQLKNETKEYGNNGFTKRDFVIKTEGEYPQEILIELIKEKCSLIDPIEIGSTITVAYNLNGRSWVNPQGETKHFNSIQGWKIEAAALGNEQPEKAPVPPKEAFDTASDNDEEEDLDPLPF